MSLMTFLSRVSDSMFLLETMEGDADLAEYKTAAKKILKSLTLESPARCTIAADRYTFYYVIERGVCYLTMAERGFPKRLAFQYLEELNREFEHSHLQDIQRFDRPYGAVSFAPKMSRIRKEYLDPQSPKNLKKLHDDLTDIQAIMTRNISDVLQRGEALSHIEQQSDKLRDSSKQFKDKSRWINIKAMYNKYAPIAAVLVLVLLVIYWRFFR